MNAPKDRALSCGLAQPDPVRAHVSRHRGCATRGSGMSQIKVAPTVVGHIASQRPADGDAATNVTPYQMVPAINDPAQWEGMMVSRHDSGGSTPVPAVTWGDQEATPGAEAVLLGP